MVDDTIQLTLLAPTTPGGGGGGGSELVYKFILRKLFIKYRQKMLISTATNHFILDSSRLTC